jgi:hypothetical protein
MTDDHSRGMDTFRPKCRNPSVLERLGKIHGISLKQESVIDERARLMAQINQLRCLYFINETKFRVVMPVQ